MPLKTHSYFICLALSCITTLHAFAQRTVLLPEFYHYKSTTNHDTVYKYELLDHANTILNPDELLNLNAVDNICYTKNYYRYPKGRNSAISPPYLADKLYIYEKGLNHTWLGIDRKTNVRTGFKEYRNKIVRADTVSVTTAGTKQSLIHKYYKVDTVDISAVKIPEE
jgi:hypothetical protein